MREFENQVISNVRLIASSREYSDIRLVNSKFTGCVLAEFDDTEFTLRVSRVAVERCRFDRCTSQQVFFEEVVADTLEMAQVHRVYGCVFKHVTFRGKIGPIMTVGPHTSLPNRQERIAAIVAAYKGIDWALDIRDALFSDASFHYVPGNLILYDSNTQVLLRREKFTDIDRRELPARAGIWVDRFDETPFDSIIAIAPKRSKDFRKWMEIIEWLHNADLAL